MQAILIMAHRDMEQIIELTELLRKKFEVYIHFDTKMNVSSEEKANLQQMTAMEEKLMIQAGYLIRDGEKMYLPEIIRHALGFRYEKGARPRVLSLLLKH